MTTEELQQQIAAQYGEETAFIAWREADKTEERIEVLDYFQRCLMADCCVDSFTLLDMEQMWQRLLQLEGGEMHRVWRKKVEVIDWLMPQPDGSQRLRSCGFRAEGLLAVYEEVLASR